MANRMVPLFGMIISVLAFVACAAWYFWRAAPDCVLVYDLTLGGKLVGCASKADVDRALSHPLEAGEIFIGVPLIDNRGVQSGDALWLPAIKGFIPSAEEPDDGP